MIVVSPLQVRHNTAQIASRIGVPIYAVVKANAYGLGITSIAPAIADLVAGFCVFSLEEATKSDLWTLTQKPILALGPPWPDATPDDYLTAHVRPSVTTVEQAARLRRASPAVCVETGMHRFTCPPDRFDSVLTAGDIHEAYTHATRPAQVTDFLRITAGHNLHLHAAGSSLMDDPACRLDAIRPGLALYRNAVRITSPIVEIHTAASAGYTGFTAARHGIILMGYRHGLRPGPCKVNGTTRRILEVGMQSAFIELGTDDRIGDEVTILGDGLEADDVATAWNVGPQEVLVSLLRADR